MTEKKKPLKAGGGLADGEVVKTNKGKDKAETEHRAANKKQEVKKERQNYNKKLLREEDPTTTSRKKNTSVAWMSDENITENQFGLVAIKGEDQDIFSNLEFGLKNRDSNLESGDLQGKAQSTNNNRSTAQFEKVDNEEKVSMSIGLDFEDSGVFYLTEEHKKVIRSLFLKLFSDSPFCFLGSLDRSLSEYYKEIIFDQIRKSNDLSILYFDPHSGPDLLTIINGALKNFELGDMQFSEQNHKRTILALDNENSVKAADWELLDVLRVELKKADMGVFCIRPETFSDDFSDKVTHMVKKFSTFNIGTLSVLEMEQLEVVIAGHNENKELQKFFSVSKNQSKATDNRHDLAQVDNSNGDHTEGNNLKSEDGFIEKFFKGIRHRK